MKDNDQMKQMVIHAIKGKGALNYEDAIELLNKGLLISGGPSGGMSDPVEKWNDKLLNRMPLDHLMALYYRDVKDEVLDS